MKRLFLSGIILISFSTSAFAIPVTYDVNRIIGDGSVVGTLTTDGTFGALTSSNIIDWSFTLTSPNLVGGLDNLTASNSNFSIGGSSFVSSASDITFDFSTANSYFIVQSNTTYNAWCATAGPIACAGEPTPSEGIYFDASTSYAELTQPSGINVIATAATTAVPEPASIALLGIGLLGLGFQRRKKIS